MSEKNPTPVENDKGESAAVPPAEPVAPVVPAPDTTTTEALDLDEVDGPVKVFLAGPMWCTSLTLSEFGDGTLVLDRNGTEVDASDLAEVSERAALSGVTLRMEVSNS